VLRPHAALLLRQEVSLESILGIRPGEKNTEITITVEFKTCFSCFLVDFLVI
jgi:hypothetical protein